MKKKYEIQYISRYYEEKEYCVKIIYANSEKNALISFAKEFNIKNYNNLFKASFYWEDGNWLSFFKCINELKK